MKRYSVFFSKRAEKDLKQLPAAVVERIVPVIVSLELNPRPIGCKKLKGYSNLWRVRVGDYRIIYSIEDTILLVDVRAVGDRKDIYN
jgi:mRNA interferase RelE/StbE